MRACEVKGTPDPEIESLEDYQVSAAMRALAANILRVVGSAGKPEEIEQQMAALMDAVSAYRTATKRSPDPAILCKHLDEWDFNLPPETATDKLQTWHVAMNAILRASLRMVAARLLNQRTHESRARNDIEDAIRRIEAIGL